MSWHAQVCSTYDDPNGPLEQKLCCLVNQSDIQPSRKQGMLRLNADSLSGALSVYVDYVYLYRDGDLVDQANPNRWYDVCDVGCDPNFVSTTWDGTTGSHAWKAVGRFKFKWRNGGEPDQWYSLWSNLWTP